jgi:hypothetical protein
MDGTARPKTPWHLWVLGILTLAFNSGGVIDYAGTHMFPDRYLAAFDQDAIDYFLGFPVWLVAFWGIGVWFAFLASALILARSRFAVHSAIAALGGLLVTSAWQYSHPWPASLDQPWVHAFSAVIWFVQLFVLWYAVKMRKAGVLR